MDVILLGEIEDKLNGVDSKIDAIKTQTDNIYSKVDTEIADIVSKVATNNTANKTGVLSQKLSYLIAQNENHGSLERTTAGSQNWTCPSGVYQVLVTACGGAGGGGGGGGGGWANYGYGTTYDTDAKHGGVGGSSDVVYAIISVTPNNTYALTVGKGGNGGVGGTHPTNTSGGVSGGEKGGSGSSGGQTKFGTLLIVNGGNGGTGGDGNKTSTEERPINNAGVNGAAGNLVTKTIYQTKIEIANSNNFVNVSGGVGGAGGTSSNSPSGRTDGSPGGVGKPGYIKIIW